MWFNHAIVMIFFFFVNCSEQMVGIRKFRLIEYFLSLSFSLICMQKFTNSGGKYPMSSLFSVAGQHHLTLIHNVIMRVLCIPSQVCNSFWIIFVHWLNYTQQLVLILYMYVCSHALIIYRQTWTKWDDDIQRSKTVCRLLFVLLLNGNILQKKNTHRERDTEIEIHEIGSCYFQSIARNFLLAQYLFEL